MPRGTPAAEVVHAIAGRTRLRIASHAGDDAFFVTLATGLAALDGVRSVRSRAVTGTFVVTHDKPFASIAASARDAGLFVAARRKVAVATERPLALPATGALALGALAVYQLLQARVLPPALTLFWYASSLARQARAADQAADGDDGD